MKITLLSIILLATVTFTATGESWESVGAGVDGPVYCLAVYENELYAGGKFESAGGIPAANIARWNGETWLPLGSGTNGAVRALCVQAGQLYVGGDFTSCGSAACDYIARWDGTNWTPAGSGLNGPVYAIAEYQRTVYIGGAFTKVGSSAANRIAAWNGTAWQDATGGLNDTVYALKVTPFNELFADLYAGGAFTRSNLSRIAWLHPAYQMWREPDWEGFNSSVFALAYYPGGILAGGAFTSNTAGSAVSHLAQRGTEFYGGADGEVYALLSNGADLYVGGTFGHVGPNPGLSVSHVAKWNGTRWQALGPGTNRSVRTMVMFQGNLYAGGEFDSAGGKRALHVARWEWTTGIERMNEHAGDTGRHLDNYPNPFNSSTTIRFTMAGDGDQRPAVRSVELKVYDVLGREVAVLVSGPRADGVHQVRFVGNGLPSGVYVCRLTAGGLVCSRTMLLMR